MQAKASIIEVEEHCALDLDAVVNNTESQQEKVGNKLCLNRSNHLYSGRVFKDLFSVGFYVKLYPGLKRVNIACYAEPRCISISYSKSVCPSVTRWLCVKTTPAAIMRSSLEDSPMTLVVSWLTSARNSKGNIGSEGAE